VFHDLTDIARTAFLGMERLEMITRNIHSHGLYISEYRFWMLRREFEKLSALISAELEVGFLNEVIHNLLRKFAPPISSANDGKANRAMKSRHEFIPGRAVFGLRAGLY
jgi:hypothetical protein